MFFLCSLPWREMCDFVCKNGLWEAGKCLVFHVFPSRWCCLDWIYRKWGTADLNLCRSRWSKVEKSSMCRDNIQAKNWPKLELMWTGSGKGGGGTKIFFKGWPISGGWHSAVGVGGTHHLGVACPWGFWFGPYLVDVMQGRQYRKIGTSAFIP